MFDKRAVTIAELWGRMGACVEFLHQIEGRCGCANSPVDARTAKGDPTLERDSIGELLHALHEG